MSLLRLLILLSLFFSCKSSKSNQDNSSSPYSFDFHKADSLTDVIEAAEKVDKLVFLDIYTDWCLPCKVMDEEVFTDERLGDYFNTHFVSHKVDAEKNAGPLIADLYKVKGYPTLLFLDLNGRILVQKRGSVGYNEMYDLADQALALNSKEGE